MPTTLIIIRRFLFLLLAFPALAQAQIRIAGSETLEDLMTAAISAYQRENKVEIKTDFKGTGAGFKELCEGRADIVPASSRITAEQSKLCAAKKITYLELPIAFDPVAVIVSKANTWANDVTMAELKTIFSPESTFKITRWDQVRTSYDNLPLKVVSLDTKSGTNALFSERISGMRNFVRSDAAVFADHAKVIAAVSADANAIGFVSLAALATHKANVRPIAVNFGRGAVIPDLTSVLSDAYAPLTRLLFIYIASSSSDKSDTKAFASYLYENGDRYVRFSGLMPLIAPNYQAGLRSIKSMPGAL
jgi:phosphate transport system substrate-binding protein